MTFDENQPMDALDRLIADGARDYNTPPPTVPRDAMWAAITAARAPQASAPRAETKVIPIASRRRTLWAVAAAAAIFLATGIGIGRWSAREDIAGPTAAPAPQVAAGTARTPAPDTATPAGSASPIEATPVERAPDAGRTTQVAAATPRRSGVVDAPAPGTDPYDVAMLRHFAQAEALLVSYRADTVDAGMDRRLASWARPLLADTRLLLDSPASSDPRRRQLLEDLELVLAQVARLAPTAAQDSTARDRGERQLIDGSIRRAQILPRLRTLVPAGT
jgi:hypothetical protein